MPTTFNLVQSFLPSGVQYEHIGSRRYMEPGLGSDYDIMVPLEHRLNVLTHLAKNKVHFEGAMAGSVKFDVDLFPTARLGLNEYNRVTYNICFVDNTNGDWEAWVQATNLMVRLSKELGTEFFKGMSKAKRIHLFASFVENFGGKRPTFPNNSSSPVTEAPLSFRSPSDLPF
jgi:hypothetical protein